ncbi:hypothetical protein M436DRAFT_72996 [Aureobasidium namibiae CBS 147.97]|uniref:AB hydrolase-1 domain-containing protein n=1 Tax=Aureobasidium namibiae CBS 147.97 TaxID=1043004 RepID=A0A074XDX1_9PEZI|nr:uncharacterized protein M436DRAFT_72996 [Aureobasidium namibiae CBS 147.97]KEQ72821.1 hypothetical protein M436DRAFT_72996 [Aureobasidium namibiae CBS 147.97]
MTSNAPETRGTINLTNSTIQLPTKTTSHLSYTFSPGTPTTKTLVVFLNGLILPKSSWKPTIIATQTKCFENNIPQPHLLSYDRYGQGDSDAHPDDTHDTGSVVNDLHTFLTTFCEQELRSALSAFRMVLVCNSIGCAIARLYCASHPSTNISGLIFLDSMMAHVDLVSLWPDVDAPGFDKSTLSEGTTIEEIRNVRQQYEQRFHVSAPNSENLDRSDLAQLLPQAGSPKLQGNPFLIIVRHDAETFAEENEKSFNVRKELVTDYVQPVWDEYNKQLSLLTSAERSKGPIVAKGCGHFIQRDDPQFVAREICEMLQKLEGKE